MPPPDLETGDSGIRAVAARDSLEIAFIGPSIEDGRIDLSALSESLYGLSNLVRRTGYLLFDHEADFSARLDQPIERGSLVVPIEVVKHGISAAAVSYTHLDVYKRQVLGTIDIGGAPEQAQSDGRGHIYVDIEDKSAIAVIDAKSMTMTGKYDLSSKSGGCAGLALDVKNNICLLYTSRCV